MGKGARDEIDKCRYDDDQRHSGEALVQNTGDACAEHSEAEYYAVVTGAAEGLGMQSMMTDLGLSAQVRVWTDSNSVETRSRKDTTRGIEVFVVAGGNQVRKSEGEAYPRGAEFGRPSDEGEAVARDQCIDPRSWRIHENESGQQGE